MRRHACLAGLHHVLAPRSYLEIGIREGRGLALSAARTIGVDPAYAIRAEVACDLQLVRATSDEFFSRPDAMAWFADGVVDLAFIDGRHLFEFALRDFINTERACTPTSVVVFDDMLPRTHAEAARERHTRAWAGDVYKVGLVLERFRPDLVVVPVDTGGTGMLVVVGLDPRSTVLSDRYDEIVAEYATPDPQQVPDDVLTRKHAAQPAALLASSVWTDLVAARTASPGESTARVDAEPLRALRGTATFQPGSFHDEPWPARSRGERLGAWRARLVGAATRWRSRRRAAR
jgi:hypothetical protein